MDYVSVAMQVIPDHHYGIYPDGPGDRFLHTIAFSLSAIYATTDCIRILLRI